MITKDDPIVDYALTLALGCPTLRKCAIVGSVAIEDQGKDFDHLWLVGDICVAFDYLIKHGFTHEGNVTYQNNDFESFRHGYLNVITTPLDKIFDTWKISVEVCKLIKTKNREQRVAIHQVIMDGLDADTINFGVF